MNFDFDLQSGSEKMFENDSYIAPRRGRRQPPWDQKFFHKLLSLWSFAAISC